MKLEKLVPIESKRIDETTGQVYVLRVAPPADFITTTGLERGENNPIEFIEYFFWQILCGEYDVYYLHELEEEIVNVFPLLKELVGSINLEAIPESKKQELGGRFSFNIRPKASFSFGENISVEFLESLMRQVLTSKAINLAMAWYIGRYHSHPDIDGTENVGNNFINDQVDEKESQVLPGSKKLAINKQWSMPKLLADSFNQGLKGVNKASIENAIKEYNNGRGQKAAFKVEGSDTEFIFDKEKLVIKTVEQFVEKLEKIKDAKVLQTFSALWKWVNVNNTSTFKNVPISDIMGLILKAQGENKFNTPQRREFTDVLDYLSSLSITVNVIGERRGEKGKKSKPVLREFRGLKLFQMVPEYSVRKEFQQIPREQLLAEHFDKSVINRFSGEFLPGSPDLFKGPTTIYLDSLLDLDANKDSKAIILGFSLQTRFNQLQDKEKFVQWDRSYLVELCDYQKTNQTKPSQATKQLANTLDKLIKAGIISKYTGLTNNDEDCVRIYPTQIAGQKAIS